MRKLLLNSTALATVAALTSGAALAVDHVSITAATEWSYGTRTSSIATLDGTSFGTDSEINFSFSNKTDSGLTIGYVVELESDDTDTAINESSLSISGGFGKVVLGENDGVGDNYGIGAKDIIAEEATPAVTSSSIGGNADISMADGDLNKIAYHLPAMGGLTMGISFQDTGTNTGTDTTQYGARYAMALAGDTAVTLGAAVANTSDATSVDVDSQNLGVTVVNGSLTVALSQSHTDSVNDDIKNNALAVSYVMANGVTVGAYTFKSEDDVDTGEEYSSAGVEIQYTVAAGLTAVINFDEYEYTAATTNAAGVAQGTSTPDKGDNAKLTLKASF